MRLSYIAAALLATAAPSFAQPVLAAKSGLLSYAEGDVTVNGQPADLSGVHFSDLKENAVLKTADGRAEILLTPGVILRVGENSSLRMISNRLIDTRLELLAGSAVIEADQIAKDTSVTIVDKDGTVALTKAGIYRFDAEPAQLKVFKGEANVEIAGNSQQISTGHVIPLSGTATLSKFDVEDTDALDRWSHRRASYLAMANTSAANSLVNGASAYGTYAGLGWMPYGAMAGWGMNGCASAWAWNPYYSMMTYMPCYGSMMGAYGYRFWSPYAIGNYSGWAPGIWGGGASRTGVSPSGSASLARPVATASNRANAPTAGVGASRGAFSGGANAGGNRVGGPAISSGGFAGNSGGSSVGSGGGGFGGGAGGGAGGGHAGGGGGGGHAGGGGGHGH